MLPKLVRSQAGYSLVEVMVSILLLSIAIIPMVGMFDAGLKSASSGGNYDQARALAKKQLEGAQSLTYNSVRTSFPSSPGPPPCSSAPFNGSGLSATLACRDSDSPRFTYEVRKQYLLQPVGSSFPTSSTPTGYMRITVTVRWDANDYSATTLKVR